MEDIVKLELHLKSILIFIGTFGLLFNGLYKFYLLYSTGYSFYTLFEGSINLLGYYLAYLWVEARKEAIYLFDELMDKKERKVK